MNIDELWNKYSHYGLINKEEFTKAIAEIISSPVEPEVKPANADLNLIAGMYAILQCQLSCVWNKLSGKEALADNDAKHLIPKIELLNKELEKRLSV